MEYQCHEATSWTINVNQFWTGSCIRKSESILDVFNKRRYLNPKPPKVQTPNAGLPAGKSLTLDLVCGRYNRSKVLKMAEVKNSDSALAALGAYNPIIRNFLEIKCVYVYVHEYRCLQTDYPHSRIDVNSPTLFGISATSERSSCDR